MRNFRALVGLRGGYGELILKVRCFGANMVVEEFFGSKLIVSRKNASKRNVERFANFERVVGQQSRNDDEDK